MNAFQYQQLLLLLARLGYNRSNSSKQIAKAFCISIYRFYLAAFSFLIGIPTIGANCISPVFLLTLNK